MRRFMIVWLGQLLSLLGSAMTRFVLAIWLWQQTGKATALVLVGVFTGISSLLANLVAGSIVDRFSRKLLLILADLLTGVLTLVLLILVLIGRLEPWHIYLTSAFAGVFGTFHYLAFSTSITLMIPRQHYTRANSLLSLAWYSSVVGGPLLAGILYSPIGITGVMLIDVASFLFAISTVAFVAIPRIANPSVTSESSWASFIFGFRYIFTHPPLRGLMLAIFAFNMFESFGYPLIAPMILARTASNEVIYGVVQSTLGIGGIVGGAIVTLWGGFKKKVYGVLLGLFLTGLLGDVLMGLGTSLFLWLPAAIFLELFIPLVVSSNNAIWQLKIPPQFQGRVFAARSLISGLGEPVALLFAGLLADRVFEPAMQPGKALASLLGRLIGTGPGAGMAFLLVICGLLSAFVALWGYLHQPTREIEALLPDHTLAESVD